MINKLNKKHKIVLIVIGIFIITSITIGISYSYWQITKKQTNANLINTGCFEVTFEETGSDIVLTNTFPITDEEGLALTPYKFKIKNICSIDAEYYVTLNSFGETNTLLNENAIKYAFDLSSKTIYAKKILGLAPENTNTSNIDLDNLIKSYYLKGGYLRVGEEKEFSLYLWIDQNAPMSEMNKTFTSKIYITSVATDEAPVIANLRTAADVPSTGVFLNGPLVKNTIESIEFITTNIVPTTALGSWDVSEQQNGAIMAWYYDKDANGKYEVYIGQEKEVFANPDSSYLFQSLWELKTINLSNLNTSEVTNMSQMFYATGENSPVFKLDLGEQFDTSSVTNMQGMFAYTGCSNTGFTLDLGEHFDTSNVTNMLDMFYQTGYHSTVFTLDLGNHFDTSNVTNMNDMFCYTGYSSPVFTLDLGDKFDTSNVTDMPYMFEYTGFNSTIFTLNLGDKFDTSNVTYMTSMFLGTGYSNPTFTLSLGEKFDTSNVTSMTRMFDSTGYNNPTFTLSLGKKFDTSNVTNMSEMFYRTGYNSTVFTLDLGSKFDTSKVTTMTAMFYETGYSSTIFTLDLGSKFNTSNVTNMYRMFYRTGYNSSVFTLDLGSKFDTSKITNMFEMFYATGYNNPNFILDLRTFNFVKVTNYNNIFSNSRTTHTAYVKNTSDKSWVSEKGFAGTIIDCSSNTCP